MRALRLAAPVLLAAQVVNLNYLNGMWADLILFNGVAITALISILFAPRVSDRWAQPITAAAVGAWSAGSIVATLTSHFTIPDVVTNLSELMYLIFYPLALLGLQRLIATHQKLTVLEVVDAAIVGLGLSTLCTAFALQSVMPSFDGDLNQSFFATLYPIADLILLCFVVAMVVMQGISMRGLLAVLGVAIFAVTDFVFLWQNINLSYSFGSIIDYGWLLAIVVISESFWQMGTDNKAQNGISPILITISVFLSATLLALLAIAPDRFPHFVIIPAIGTLALAFIRMSIALSQARNIGQERILARTDELTLLPNRRKLIAEIESFASRKGSLLLLDLDGFKPVNDSFGHEVGDKVLQQVAQRFSRALSSSTLLARLGGDEFGVLIDGAHENPMEIALALRGTLSYPFVIDGHEILIGVSIGIADNNGSNDLLLRADNAMYAAKRQAIGVYRL